MDNYPTGTVTLLFTDIEGSTLLFETHPEVMQQALARHHAILRDAIASHHGYVFQIVGDSFAAAFDTATDALAAASAAQRALQTEAWGDAGALRVRMGLHSGAVQVRLEDTTAGQYSGHDTMARAQRVMSAAYGGQVLLSGAAMELARGRLPEGVSLRDLGEHRLKGIPEPEHLWQLVAAGLRADFPPLQSLDSFPNNLPTRLSTFIGRENDIALVKQKLAGNRLVTLTGSGGVGKTRLAIEVGRDSLPLYANGAWLVELASYSDPVLVPQAVASVFELHEESGRPLPTLLLDYLRRKSLLLILDNCEHVIDAAAQLTVELLRHCPDLHILASSREALGVEGEAAVRVPSLSLPPLDHATPETLATSEAARLFAERAAAVAPDFVISDANASAVAQVCRRLDGIPLAIELAASRAKLLSAEQIATRLDDAFRLLTGGSRTAVPRQQTLRALIDWSYNLLSQPERTLLRRLSVFMGGWTLEAAEAVCPCDGFEEYEVMDVLGQLIDKSLVTVEPDQADETRYTLLETIRQYAREKLLDAGDGETARGRHLEYYCRLAEQAEPRLHGSEAIAAMDMLEVEHNNLRAALEWSLATPAELGLRLASSVMWFWDIRGYAREGVRWFEKLLPLASEAPATVRATALASAGWLAFLAGNHAQGSALSAEALALHRQVGNKGGAAFALSSLGFEAWAEEDYARAADMLQESSTLFGEAGLVWGMVQALGGLGMTFHDRNDYVQAESIYDESLRLARKIGDVDEISWVLGLLAALAVDKGEYERALVLFEESLSLAHRVKNKMLTAASARRAAILAAHAGQAERARIMADEAVRVSRDAGISSEISRALLAEGFVAHSRGDDSAAARDYAEALLLAHEAQEKGSTALALLGIADLAAAHGHHERSARLAGAAEAADKDWRPKAIIPRQEAHDRQMAAVRAALGEQAFAAAWAEGQTMTTEQAVAEALAIASLSS